MVDVYWAELTVSRLVNSGNKDQGIGSCAPLLSKRERERQEWEVARWRHQYPRSWGLCWDLYLLSNQRPRKILSWSFKKHVFAFFLKDIKCILILGRVNTLYYSFLVYLWGIMSLKVAEAERTEPLNTLL